MQRLFLLLSLIACDPAESDSGSDERDSDSDSTVEEIDTDPDTMVEDDGDGDGDGFPAEEDCDDGDAAVSPVADEVCDGIDNDCDGEVDVGAVDAPAWFVDGDGDGYGGDDSVVSCAEPPGRVNAGGDCDDENAAISPGAAEVCDGLDNDCDAGTSEAGTVSFLSSASGTTVDLTEAFEAGLSHRPYEHVSTEAGRLSFCGGEWFTSIDAQYPLTVRGVGGAEENVLSGADRTRVVQVNANVQLRDITLTHGLAGEHGVGVGGALLCDSGSTLLIQDAIISRSEGRYGGAMALDGCTVSIYDTEIIDNYATSGGAMSIVDGEVYLEGVTISGNSASAYGGALYLVAGNAGFASDIDLELVDTLVVSNTVDYYGAAMFAYSSDFFGASSVDIRCERTSSGSQGGFQGNLNSNSYSSGLYLRSDDSTVSLESVGCDLGGEGTSDDNSPVDIIVASFTSRSSEHDYGDGATFACDSGGCE